MYATCAFNEHGTPSHWRVVNTHGDEWGTCHAHLAPTLIVLGTNDAPVTVQPIFWNWPATRRGNQYPCQICANCGTSGPPDLDTPDQRWLCERCL